MLRLIIVALLLATPADAGTRVFGFYGLGGQRTSTGIDEIADQARNIPGVTHLAIYNYWETGRAADDIVNVPPEDKIVLYGYSCGANSMTTIAYDLRGMRWIDTIAGIQQSQWCGGTDLHENVGYGQMTYGSCIETLGLGCKRLTAGEGFAGSIVNIRRPDSHPEADNDPDAQADVLNAITITAAESVEPPPEEARRHLYGHGHLLVRRGIIKMTIGGKMVQRGVQEIVLHHGEQP